MNYKSYSDILEEGLTSKDYFKQFKNTAKPILGKTYVVHPNSWQECKIKIVHIHDNVALGVEVEGLCVGGKRLYYSNGNNIGFAYNDIARPSYRLQYI